MFEMRSAYLSMSGCSGAMTMKVTPKRVSGRVVYMRSVSSVPERVKLTNAPVERPIQFSC